MDVTNCFLVTYLVNAMWQVPTITIVAALCARLMHHAPPRYKHRLWVAALLLGIVLPLLSLGSASGGLGISLTATEQTIGMIQSSSSKGSTQIFSWFGGRPHRKSLFFNPLLTWLLTCGYTASCCYSLACLGWAWRRTTRLRASSCVRPLPDRLAKIVEGFATAFNYSHIPILSSDEIAGPVTIGLLHPVLILPKNFFTGVSEVDFSSAICHELAHIRRHDFALNLAYELISLPVSFHPATAMMKARLGQTRELVCDEIASTHLANRTLYARSLLNIAQSINAKPSKSVSSYALGMFDNNTMEERVIRLLDKSNPPSKRMRIVLVSIAASLLALFTIVVSAFSLQVAQTESEAVNLKPFVGIWTARFQGKTFVTLNLKEERGKMTGTCMHTVNMAEDDQGRLTRVDEKQTLDEILNTQIFGTNAVLSICESDDPQKVAKFDMRLTGTSAAEMRPVHHVENKITTQWWKLSRSSGGL